MVSSFEGDFLGVRHLLELALSSPYVEPPKLMFLSSIGVLASESLYSSMKIEHPEFSIPPSDHRSAPPNTLVPEDRVEPASAIGTGYAESKWVVEEILLQVSDEAKLPTTTVRLGQVSGDRLGHWNEREWFPAMVKSSLFARCLPGDMNEVRTYLKQPTPLAALLTTNEHRRNAQVAFIPSYPAARAFVEMRRSSARTLHLVHPRPVPWKAIIAPIAEELGVPLVPHTEWLAALEQCAVEGDSADQVDVDAMRENPALRLLDFFRAQGGGVGSGAHLSTAEAEQISEELARMPELTPGDARRWVAAWRASGFLPTMK